MYNHDVGSYHYNFDTGQELSNPEMLAHLGYTDDAKVMHRAGTRSSAAF